LAFGTHMEVRSVCNFFSGNLKELDHLEDLGKFGRIILKHTLKKWNVRIRMCMTWDRNNWQTLVKRLIKFLELLGKLNEFLLYKKDCAVLSWSPTVIKQDWQPFNRRLCICLVICKSQLFIKMVTNVDDLLIAAYFKVPQAYFGLIYSSLVNQP
jgi:hypothetical protein